MDLAWTADHCITVTHWNQFSLRRVENVEIVFIYAFLVQYFRLLLFLLLVLYDRLRDELLDSLEANLLISRQRLGRRIDFHGDGHYATVSLAVDDAVLDLAVKELFHLHGEKHCGSPVEPL